MRAWVVDRPGPIDSAPLVRVDREPPAPGPGQLLVQVSCCGVCRTDLHLAEGDLAPKRPRVTPGHEVVGTVDRAGRRGGPVRGRAADWRALARRHRRHLPVLSPWR